MKTQNTRYTFKLMGAVLTYLVLGTSTSFATESQALCALCEPNYDVCFANCDLEHDGDQTCELNCDSIYNQCMTTCSN